MRLQITTTRRTRTHKPVALVVGVLLISAVLTAVAQTDQPPQNHVVRISYYGYDGDLDFSINPSGEIRIAPGDSITYHTDDRGTLLLRLDDGSVYQSADGEVTLSTKQLAATKRVRCSMLLPDGSLVGWEVAHEDRYGGQHRIEGEDRRASTQKAPSYLQALPGDGKVSLSWKSEGSSSYSVKRATAPGGPYVKLGLATTTSFIDVRVTNDKTYYYVVTAVNSSGESGNSNEISATPRAESTSSQ
jgi:hypothetical protein